MTPFIKKFKFTQVAFALAATFAGSVSASAVEGWYASLSGGASYIPNYVSRINVKNNWGWNAGAEVGYKSGPLRYALEGRYMRANMDSFGGFRFRNTGLNAYTQVGAALANIYFDFDNVAANFTPFVGVGVGLANVQAKFDNRYFNFRNNSGSDTRFAYKATLGANIDITESLALTVAYLYLGTTKLSTDKSFQSHSTNVGLTFKFNS